MCGNCCSSPIRDSPHRFLCSKRSKAVRLTRATPRQHGVTYEIGTATGYGRPGARSDRPHVY